MIIAMANLFGKNKLREIAAKLQASELEDKITLARTWHNDYHNGSLKTDKEIDQLVYKIYNLTPEEIKIVEMS